MRPIVDVAAVASDYGAMSMVYVLARCLAYSAGGGDVLLGPRYMRDSAAATATVVVFNCYLRSNVSTALVWCPCDRGLVSTLSSFSSSNQLI